MIGHSIGPGLGLRPWVGSNPMRPKMDLAKPRKGPRHHKPKNKRPRNK
jgi:hypothetical protein